MGIGECVRWVGWVVVRNWDILRGQPVVDQILLVPVQHAVTLPLKVLPDPCAERQRVFKHFVPKLWPDPPPWEDTFPVGTEGLVAFTLSRELDKVHVPRDAAADV